MDMNALATDWPEAPTNTSFRLAQRRAEMTFMTAANATSTSTTTTTTTTKPLTKAKKKAKPKLSGKEKKGRLHEHQSCPEKLHCSMESIIEALMDNEGRGVKHVFIGLIAPPDLNQAWVNKCLIALVNRELVRKDNTMGTVLYHWQGLS
ncbi:hypothetical protein EDD17DRAFT_1526548 [Pisolithus thermaeus]|nr:hypothetical protein EDD17DRAFT_1526548 [Pisolithus thermaeus]